MAQPVQTTERMATLLGLMAEGRLVETRQYWDNMIQTEPGVAAQWYLLAQLLQCDTLQRQQQIAEGLGQLGDGPRRSFQRLVQTVHTFHRLHRFLAQVRQAKPDREASQRAVVRTALTDLLHTVQRCKEARPARKASTRAVSQLELLLAKANMGG
ncbi:MAG: hypothetical protein HQL90_07250 [Magnetococcales bacterium]|nr:hypothetical protein [Magnetococcales bacterium]